MLIQTPALLAASCIRQKVYHSSLRHEPEDVWIEPGRDVIGVEICCSVSHGQRFDGPWDKWSIDPPCHRPEQCPKDTDRRGAMGWDEEYELVNLSGPNRLIVEKPVELLGGAPDVVLSDMAPNTVGHRETDHLRIVGLIEAAIVFALEVLKPGGTFVAKSFQGGGSDRLIAHLKRHFTDVKNVKPKASRQDSSEVFLVATGYKGR